MTLKKLQKKSINCVKDKYMKDRLVYLSGAISGIPEEEAYEWRDDVENFFEQLDLPWLHVFNPVTHFSHLDIIQMMTL